MLEAGPQLRARDRDADVPHARPGAAARHVDAGQAVRLLRRHRRRRLAGAGRAVHERIERAGASSSGGGARACSAAAPITGAASRCATARTISSRTARDGLGFDWPIDYEDVAPYYDKVEMLIGVYGDNEGLENTPNSPAGVSAAAAEAARRRAADAEAREDARHSGRRRPSRGADAAARLHARCRRSCIPATRARSRSSPSTMRSRAACFWATPMRPRLLDQGELPVDHGAPAAGAGDRQSRHRHRRDGARGDARQATARRPASSSSTRRRGKEQRAKARVVVLAASACETVRILLNSKSRAVPARARELAAARSAST